MATESKALPCNGCTACCRKERIRLQPERGDIVENYRYGMKDGRAYLLQNANGDCVYLTPQGCSIWPNHPVMCKEMDCRIFLCFTRQERNRLIAKECVHYEVIEAAQKLAQRCTTPFAAPAWVGKRRIGASWKNFDKLFSA